MPGACHAYYKSYSRVPGFSQLLLARYVLQAVNKALYLQFGRQQARQKIC
jgi:hypothetical protein